MALIAAFRAILCAFHFSASGGGGMMIGARTAAWANDSIDPYNCDVEFLETRNNTGNALNDAYFITKFVPDQDAKLIIDWSLTKHGYIGIYDNGARFGIGSSNTLKPNGLAWELSSWNTTGVLALGERFTAILDSKNAYVKFGDFYESDDAGRCAKSTLLPMYLFDCCYAGNIDVNSHFNGKIYRSWCYDDGVLVHGYVGHLKNGVPCLRDFVTGEIIEKSGNGDLFYGDPIKTVDQFGN